MEIQEMSNFQEREVLNYISKIISITSLDQLLKTIVKETPSIFGFNSCSIYLIPDLVP